MYRLTQNNIMRVNALLSRMFIKRYYCITLLTSQVSLSKIDTYTEKWRGKLNLSTDCLQTRYIMWLLNSYIIGFNSDMGGVVIHEKTSRFTRCHIFNKSTWLSCLHITSAKMHTLSKMQTPNENGR